MNNDHVPRTPHAEPSHEGKGMSSPGNDEAETSNAVRRRKTKHATRACNPCRRKKSRCNGERPTCALCMIHNDDCTYDTAQDRRRPVSKAYVTALEHRVAWLESMLEGHGEGERIGESGEDTELRGLDSAGSSTLDRLLMRPTASQERIERLQIDNATGEVHEYGPTSVFRHFPPSNASPAIPAQPRTSPSDTVTTAAGNAAILYIPDGFDEEMHQNALRAFFAFFNPWCWWVDEERFRNDMGVTPADTDTVVRQNLRTAYYSPLLHFAILAIGVMYLDYRSHSNREFISDSFARNAASFFEDEIEATKPSAVIGLMLLGTHHAGHARQNLGYIYTGAGLRLTRILGLGVDASSWVEMDLISPQIKRYRDRVWHTAYIQDKLWASYVGRAPAPNLSQWRMPSPATDDEEDARPWASLGNSAAEQVRGSWMASTFTWTCKLARIVELVLINIYSTRRDANSEKTRNIKFELRVLLEKWQAELPDPIRVSHAIFRDQDAPTMLPHVLVMNIMFHFAVILLNRPDYCDTSNPGATTKTMNVNTTTARDKCHQAALLAVRLAEVFDHTFGLRYAPVSMTQFIFTAGTIHLLGAANGKRVESNTALVMRCIDVLYSMGQTWKCAMQSGSVLQRLLQEWDPKLWGSDRASTTAANSNAPGGQTEGSTSSSPMEMFDIQEVLQQNPEVVQQLQRLGWVPPQLNMVPSSQSDVNLDLETLLMGPFHVQAPNTDAAIAHRPFIRPETDMDDISWMSHPSGWTDNSYPSALASLQEQSLFGMLMRNEGMAPEALSNHSFNVQNRARRE